MRKHESEEEFKRHCELLMERGFISGSLYDDRTKTAIFQFTPEGKELRRHLRKLFDIPTVHPISLTPREVANVVMVIMFTPPPDEVI